MPPPPRDTSIEMQFRSLESKNRKFVQTVFSTQKANKNIDFESNFGCASVPTREMNSKIFHSYSIFFPMYRYQLSITKKNLISHLF